MINNYKQYNESIKSNESIYFDEYLINEGFNLDSLKKLNKEQLKSYLNKTFDLLKSVKDLSNRKKIIKLLFLIYVVYSSFNTNVNNQKQTIDDTTVETIAKNKNLNHHNLFNFFNEYLSDVKKDMKNIVFGIDYDSPLNYSISSDGINLIKDYEKLVLKGYNIGDGKVTIGYGHAEPIKNSKFKVGQVITEETADELLKEDLKEAEDGVHRMFSQWKEKGNDLKITQSMYDTLVSMAFNMGISGLRNSDFIEHIEKGDFITSSELIKKAGNNGKFKGLDNRRESEKELFLSDNEHIGSNFVKKFKEFK